MAAMTPLHAEKYCHLESAHAASAPCICSSVRQFLIHIVIRINCFHINFVNGKRSEPAIIIGSDRRPETKQGIEGKIDRFRSGRVRDRVKDRIRVRDKDRRSEPDPGSEPNTVLRK